LQDGAHFWVPRRRSGILGWRSTEYNGNGERCRLGNCVRTTGRLTEKNFETGADWDARGGQDDAGV
jgi:hypothetical protein